jgi:hypothetical protein
MHTTSPGNTRLNVLIHYAAYLYANVDFAKLPKEACVMVCGDDNLVTGSTALCNVDVSTFAARMGITLKVQKRDKLCDVKFLSRMFWPTTDECGNSTYVLGPCPGRFISRLGWDVHMVSKKQRPALFKGILLGYQKEVAHVPVLGEYVNHLLELMASQAYVCYLNEYRQLVAPGHTFPVTEDGRNLFFQRYGIESARVVNELLAIDTPMMQLNSAIVGIICKRDIE